MRRSLRLAVAACAAVVGLAFTGSAVAAYGPSLIATSSSNSPGKPTTMILGHVQETTDDPTAKDSIYAPLGYQVNLTQPIGTKIGTVSGSVVLRDVGNAEVRISGDVVVDNPANYPAASNRCTPGQTHEAVWVLNVTIAGTPIPIPIYVDHAAGPEATFASANIQFCLTGPIGTPSGAQLLFAIFDVNGVFTNPSTTTDRLWRATFTPYTPGTPNPNPGGTTEGQAVVPGRVSLTLTVKRLKHRVVLLQGRLLVDGAPFPGATIELYTPGKKAVVGKGKTNKSGRFSIRKKLKKKTRFHAEVLFLGQLASCPAAPLPGVPQGCKTGTISFVATTKTVLAKPRR